MKKFEVSKINLAPLAGVTDYPFREICRFFGAECTETEMISAKAVYYGDKKSLFLADITRDRKSDAKIGIQVFGSDTASFAKAISVLSENKPDFFDINMGCPVKKVVSAGDGSALMKTPEKCGDLVKAVKSVTDIPVTVKIRAGFDLSSINAVKVAEICEKAGADCITVHGRTRNMMYSGKSDRQIIKNVKESVGIPVIGNGDIFCAEDAVSMISETHCDGILVARGALGNPFIFREIKAALKNEKYEKPSFEELKHTMLRHVELQSEFTPENLLMLRKQIAWYTKGIRNGAEARRKSGSAVTKSDFVEIIEEIFQNF